MPFPETSGRDAFLGSVLPNHGGQCCFGIEGLVVSGVRDVSSFVANPGGGPKLAIVAPAGDAMAAVDEYEPLFRIASLGVCCTPQTWGETAARLDRLHLPSITEVFRDEWWEYSDFPISVDASRGNLG